MIQEQGQIAITLDPLREHGVDDRLGRGPDHEWLFELRGRIDCDRTRAFLTGRAEARMRDERDFLGEPLNVLGFLGEEAHRDEQGEVGVAVPARAEHVVERALHQLPDAIAMWTDHHAAAYR